MASPHRKLSLEAARKALGETSTFGGGEASEDPVGTTWEEPVEEPRKQSLGSRLEEASKLIKGPLAEAQDWALENPDPALEKQERLAEAPGIHPGDLNRRMLTPKSTHEAKKAFVKAAATEVAADTAIGKAAVGLGMVGKAALPFIPTGGITKLPQFKNWFGKSKVVDDAGEPIELFHGTPHKFDQFKPGSQRGAFGDAIYFSDSPQDVNRNYTRANAPDAEINFERMRERLTDAVESLDGGLADLDPAYDKLILKSAEELHKELTSKYSYGRKYKTEIAQLEELLSTTDTQGLSSGEVSDMLEVELIRRMAKRHVFGDQAWSVLKTYAKMDNPVYLDPSGKKGRTFFDREFIYDTEGNIIDEEGAVESLFEAIDDVAYDYDVSSEDIGALKEFINSEYEGVDAVDLVKFVKDGEIYITDMDTGDLVNSAFIKDVFEKMGYDGIIADAYHYFGPSKYQGVTYGGMEGLDRGTYHYMVFDPKQVKSATGNQGTFDPTDPRITYGVAGGAIGAKEIHDKMATQEGE
jgi:hypothetical protein